MEWLPVATLFVAVVGVGVAVVSATFAWRIWLRDRRIVRMTFSTEWRSPGSAEPGRDRALHLRIVARCRRGTIRIQGIALQGQRGGQALRGESFVGDTTHGITLGPGEEVEQYFSSDTFAAAHSRDAASVGCWNDAEDHWHCEKVPIRVVQELLADSGRT